MKTLVILSHENSYLEGVIKMNNVRKNYFFDHVYIEELSLGKINAFKNYNCTYILNNNPIIRKFLQPLKKKCEFLINYGYWMFHPNKIQVQQILCDEEINTSSIIYPLPDIRSDGFIIKSSQHTGGVVLPNDIDSKLYAKIDKNEYYLEKFIENGTEYKIYVVKDKIFTNYSNIEKLNSTLMKISKILKLDVFSVDVIISKDTIHIIDVNPASAFFKNDFARKAFVNYIASLKT